jgi:uncharacterized membrane protein
MSFCTKCGTQVDVDAKFCPSCGAAIVTGDPVESGAAVPPFSTPETAAPTPNQVNTPLGNIDFSFDSKTAGTADPQDVAANKGMAIVSYIIFFIPLIVGAHKTSPFVRFHVNQGTALFIVAVIYCVALAIISYIIYFILPLMIWPLFSLVFFILDLAPLALMIIGIINAANGTLKQLPIIGGLNIIK